MRAKGGSYYRRIHNQGAAPAQRRLRLMHTLMSSWTRNLRGVMNYAPVVSSGTTAISTHRLQIESHALKLPRTPTNRRLSTIAALFQYCCPSLKSISCNVCLVHLTHHKCSKTRPAWKCSSEHAISLQAEISTHPYYYLLFQLHVALRGRRNRRCKGDTHPSNNTEERITGQYPILFDARSKDTTTK